MTAPLSIIDRVLDGRNANLAESDDVLRILHASDDGRMIKYGYRGFRFTVAPLPTPRPAEPHPAQAHERHPTATAQPRHASDATSSTTPATAATAAIKDAPSSPVCKRTTRKQATTIP
jgi:hypothetical protein